jgi:hypothetical protein
MNNVYNGKLSFMIYHAEGVENGVRIFKYIKIKYSLLSNLFVMRLLRWLIKIMLKNKILNKFYY